MTPKEKAKELFTKFSSNTVHYDAAKQCALIAVDEVLENSHTNVFTKYWEEVKKEIEKL
jgi:hemoglobin-like flavoprotein